MIGDFSKMQSIFIIYSYTDMRKFINGIIVIIKDADELNPF